LLASAGGLAAALAGTARAEEPVVPAPVELVHGRTLRLEEHNCAIDSPGETWEWLTQKSADARFVNFFAKDKSGHARVPIVFQIDTSDLPSFTKAQELDTLVEILKPIHAAGTIVEDGAKETAQIPIAFHSMHYAARLKKPDGTWGLEGYIGRKRKTYSVSRVTPILKVDDAKDDPNLRAMAQSFQLIDTTVSDIEPPGLSPVRVTIFVALLLGLPIGGIYLLVRFLQKRKERALARKKH
jgi:hypothetical protein